MKKLSICVFAVIVILVAFNASTRPAPSIEPSVLFGSDDIPVVMCTAASAFLIPGTYALWYLGFGLGSHGQLLAMLIVSWWAWLVPLRFAWCCAARFLGVASIGSYRYWLWFTPPWRPVYATWLRVARWCKQFQYGSRATAGWTGVWASMLSTFHPAEGVFIGILWAHGIGLFQPLGVRGEKHAIVVAAAGAGKTRWMMAGLGMLHFKASAFVIDCDGQIINALGEPLQRKGHKVLNLDPYHLTRFPCASWNPISEITAAVNRHDRKAAVRYAQTLAEALIREENKLQPIFANSARVFVLGLILYVWLFEPEENRNLIRLRELLTCGMPERVIDPKQEAFEILLSAMANAVKFDDGCNGQIVAVIARAAGVMKAGKTRGGNPFRSNAISATSWLDLPELAAVLRKSDFQCADLKTSNPCVFICAPVTDIQNKLAGWVRALTVMTLYVFQNMPGRLRIPCSFYLDEFASLGRMEIVETAAPVFRKYGVRLVILVQDLERLRQAYPDSWGGFLGNAQCIIWMGTNHQETAEYLSKDLGTCTILVKVGDGPFSKAPTRVEKREQPLMTADQARQFLDPERRQIIVTRCGKPPMKVAYAAYDRWLSLRDFTPDPNFGEPLPRALTRYLFNVIAKPVP